MVDFDNILDHVIPMDDFGLKQRFTDANYKILPQQHLDQLKPLDHEASKFLWDYISKTDLHADIPFKRNFFKNIDKVEQTEGNEKEIRKWLYQRGLPFGKEVYLSWQPDTAMIAPWKLLIKYFDDFNYADDLTVIDRNLNWALLFFHEGTIYFGTNKYLKPDDVNVSDEMDYLW